MTDEGVRFFLGICPAPGHNLKDLRRSVENPDRYILLVRWQALEDHTEGFRRSAVRDALLKGGA